MKRNNFFHKKLTYFFKAILLYHIITFMNRKLFKFSATSIANFVKNDPIVDFLDILKKEGCTINSDLSINYQQTTNDKKRKRADSIDENVATTIAKQPSAFDYIMDNGNEFEKNIIAQIKQQMADSNELNMLLEIAKSTEIKQYDQTRSALKSKKYSIITGAVLHNKYNNSYGYPDLIVKGCWLQKYIKQLLVPVFQQQYYIIDIKSSTIPLVAGNTRIGASALFDSYKMQVFVYTDAMNVMLGNKHATTTTGFILGKRYKYTQSRQTLYENSPFANIGVIDFTEKNYNKLVDDAIAFKNNLQNDWQNIKLLPIDTTVMPNMKNHYDKSYHGMKYKIAEANKDITLLWNCGHKQRKLAMENGITRYDNKQLTANMMGFNEDGNIYPILSKMIEMNKERENEQGTIHISARNNHGNWQTAYPNEWFVDFETYDSETAYDEANDFNDSLNVRNLYLIGLYGGNNEYICYLLKNEHVILPDFPAHFTLIYCETEKEMLEKFIARCAGISRLIHWSTAETVIFNRKIREHGLASAHTINWFDLLDVFKHREHPIIIKDCFTFGLKDVVRKLNKHGHINLAWSDLDDGLLSAFWAKDIYIHKKDEDNRLAKLVHYNFTDCLALHVVLQFIREKIAV